jgi:hypothetical protein
MQQLQTFEQSAIFDPTNPDQIVYERYTGIPGGYGSFYFNRVPTATQRLNGRSLAGTMSIPVWLQALLVAGTAAGAAYGGMRLYRHMRG